ncbi:MAG: hypothetical protein Ct9H300mP32_0370 [Verrucomicrobiota bacterium]|nr:MAG: hypothetical protein Ct9H300mP32_0370 [Verrucomicrobiota bacterium]
MGIYRCPSGKTTINVRDPIKRKTIPSRVCEYHSTASSVGKRIPGGPGEPAYRNQPNPSYQSYLKMSDSAKGPSEFFTFIEVHPVSLCPGPFFWA